MTVKELKEKLSLLNDNANIIFNCEDINSAKINNDFDIQTNDSDDNSPVFFEFSLDKTVCPPNIKSTYKNKYFDEIGYKNSTSETCVFGMNNDHRMPMWISVQSETGMWDERVSWGLDTFMLEQIYTWLKIYLEHADGFVDLSFYKFDISFDGGKTVENKTEREWILQSIDLIKEYLLSVDTFDLEKEHRGQECAKKAFIILGEILPTLWW
jgi:hypothetical protein